MFNIAAGGAPISGNVVCCGARDTSIALMEISAFAVRFAHVVVHIIQGAK